MLGTVITHIELKVIDNEVNTPIGFIFPLSKYVKKKKYKGHLGRDRE